jgi:hypothetical protein
MRYKGIVQGKVVILEEGVHLPDGVRVTVIVEQEEQVDEPEVTPEELAQRHTLGAHMRAFGQRLAGRHVHLGDLILEERQELEDHA